MNNYKIDLVYQNYYDCEVSNITPAGVMKLQDEILKNNEKAIAVQQWINDLYAERDAKLNILESGGDVDVLPSSPLKPYSFREILEK